MSRLPILSAVCKLMGLDMPTDRATPTCGCTPCQHTRLSIAALNALLYAVDDTLNTLDALDLAEANRCILEQTQQAAEQQATEQQAAEQQAADQQVAEQQAAEDLQVAEDLELMNVFIILKAEQDALAPLAPLAALAPLANNKHCTRRSTGKLQSQLRDAEITLTIFKQQ
ncbi:hypothetical protein T492DRAFT_869847 [Pavlovales sp. CCMP2436]|nr:hypothetical protein T492DRAFT_869847 [Pavlovales sp. CCMP2436]